MISWPAIQPTHRHPAHGAICDKAPLHGAGNSYQMKENTWKRASGHMRRCRSMGQMAGQSALSSADDNTEIIKAVGLLGRSPSIKVKNSTTLKYFLHVPNAEGIFSEITSHHSELNKHHCLCCWRHTTAPSSVCTTAQY